MTSEELGKHGKGRGHQEHKVAERRDQMGRRESSRTEEE